MVEKIFKSQYTKEEKIKAAYTLLARHLQRFYNVKQDGNSYSISLDNIVGLLHLTEVITLELTTDDYYLGKSLSNIITKFEDDHNLKEDDIEIIICLSGR